MHIFQCSHILIQTVENYFFDITTNLIRKFFKCWQAVRVADTSFSKLFHLKYQILQLAIILFRSVALLEVTGLLCSFVRKYLPDTQI